MTQLTKSVLVSAVSLVLGLGIVFLLIAYSGFSRFFAALRRIDPGWLVLSVGIYAAAWLVRTFRLRVLTAALGTKISWFQLFKIRIAGYALNSLLPAKMGDLASAGFLRMGGVPTGAALAGVFQARILDFLSLVLISVPAVFGLVQTKPPVWLLTSLASCLVIVLIPYAILLLDKQRKVEALLDRVQGTLRSRRLRYLALKLKETYRYFIEVALKKNLFLPLVGLSVTVWLLEGTVCYSVALSLKAEIPLLSVLLAVCVANAGRAVPITPGGIGVYEGMLSAVLMLFGIPAAVAVPLAVLDHALKKLFNLAVGIPASLNLGFSLPAFLEERREDFRAL